MEKKEKQEEMITCDNFVGFSKYLESQLKYYHWQTNSYSEHKVLDEIIKEISELIDDYVEMYQGIYNAKIQPIDFPSFTSYESKMQIIEELEEYRDFTMLMREKESSSLLNIIDEIINVVSRGIYLLKLNG